MSNVVPLQLVVKEILLGTTSPLGLSELRGLLLNAGVAVETAELSSCMVKLMGKGSVTRSKGKRLDGGLGRRRVWRYAWKG